MLLALALAIGSAAAAPNHALGVDGAFGTTGADGALSWRVGWRSGLQLGVEARGQDVTTGWIDGYAIDRGVGLYGLVGLTVPLARADRVRVDLEVDAGARHLIAAGATRSADRSLTLVADLSPLVTVQATERVAVRLGWTHVFHQQVSPSVALDAQGGVLQAGVVLAPTDHLQWTAGVQGGGLFGYDGDGGKFLARAHTGLRWVPGAARTWTNH